MISIAFLLCSTLLLSGAIAQEESAVDVSKPEDPIYVEAAKQSAAAAIRVLNDVLDGKPVQDSLLDRGIEAMGKVRGSVASMGHSFLKRLKELKDGTPIGEVAAKIWQSANNRFTGTNKNYDEIVAAAGADNIEHFISKLTEVIQESIMDAMKKRAEAKKEAIEAAPTEA